MISRRAARTLAEVYGDTFSHSRRVGTSYNQRNERLVSGKGLHDYLYVRNHDAWFLEAINALNNHDRRQLVEFIMGLHTGASLLRFTKDWQEDARKRLGQRLLTRLAEDILYLRESPESVYWISDSERKKLDLLTSHLELDGYTYRDGTLRLTEANVLDEKEEEGTLSNLISRLDLQNKEIMDKHLIDSAKAYMESRWWDCIGNSRAFMEAVFQEVAGKHCLLRTGQPLEKKTYDTAIRVREYLENQGLFSSEEIMAVAKVYGLMSETGNHPYLADKDQARLGRNLALTVSQFALLKLQSVAQILPERSSPTTNSVPSV